MTMFAEPARAGQVGCLQAQPDSVVRRRAVALTPRRARNTLRSSERCRRQLGLPASSAGSTAIRMHDMVCCSGIHSSAAVHQ